MVPHIGRNIPLRTELPEIFASTTATSKATSRMLRGGEIRQIAGSVYTRDMATPLELIVATRLREIIAAARPEAVISGRSASLAARPTRDGSVYLTHRIANSLELPGGITLRSAHGAGPLDGDVPLVPGLYLASEARQLLEHMVPSRSRGERESRTFNRGELEGWLDQKASQENGEQVLRGLREDAEAIAAELGLAEYLPAAQELVGAFLGTRETRGAGPGLRARQAGRPFDSTRLARFDALLSDLLRSAPRTYVPPSLHRRAVLPFVEAYFSNFIEGTEFTFGEAAEIVYEDRVPAARPADAHDIMGTYRLLSDESQLVITPGSPEHFLDLLRSRHAMIMEGRPEKNPGEWKTRANRAGATTFVSPGLVRGTLIEAFSRYAQLRDPFARGVFLMFAVAEVHPFDDGNGRLARAMLTSELVAGGYSRAIVPTVLRNDYLQALRALTNNGAGAALISVIDFACRYTALLDCSSLQSARADLEATNAFEEADQPGIRLQLPESAAYEDRPSGGQ